MVARHRVGVEHVAVSSSPRVPDLAGDPVTAVAGPGGRPSSPGASASAPDHRYLLDNARAEAGERFVWLAELFDGVTVGHFGRLGLSAGWRCWEVGAGGR